VPHKLIQEEEKKEELEVLAEEASVLPPTKDIIPVKNS
jgi:hypothetical protein